MFQCNNIMMSRCYPIHIAGVIFAIITRKIAAIPPTIIVHAAANKIRHVWFDRRGATYSYDCV